MSLGLVGTIGIIILLLVLFFLGMPVGFAMAVIGFCGFWYVVSYVVMIFFFSFFWTALMFQPAEIANNLKENGGFVPGLRPGKRTSDYLENVMYRVTLAGATFLAVIAIIPQVISTQFPR